MESIEIITHLIWIKFEKITLTLHSLLIKKAKKITCI